MGNFKFQEICTWLASMHHNVSARGTTPQITKWEFGEKLYKMLIWFLIDVM